MERETQGKNERDVEGKGKGSSCNKLSPQWLILYKIIIIIIIMGQRVIGISGFMNRYLFPVVNFGEVRKGPVSQNHSPHLHVDTPGIFSDLVSSIQIVKRE